MKILPEEILKEMVNRLVGEFQPEKIILFGSYAWGTPNQDSDIDMLIIVPASNLPPVKRAIRAHQCLRELFVPKDILVKTRAEVERARRVYASLTSRILEEGKTLYGRR